MGLNLRRLGQAIAAGPTILGASLIPRGGGIRTTALGGAISAAFPAAAPFVSALMPALSTGVTESGGGDVVIEPTTIPGGQPAIFGAVARMTPVVFNAIVKLSQRLGGAGRSVAGYGTRVWATLSAWAAKNPGVSLISLLVSLGLTVEEAAHFIAWGTTRKRHRRARGISSRDLRTTRRTARKIISMTHTLRELCGGVRAPRRARRLAHRST